MRNVEIKNKDILDTLDKYLDFYYNRDKYISAGLKLQGHAFTDREVWINDEHRDNIINLGHGHSGYPEASVETYLKKKKVKTLYYHQQK